MLTSLLIASTLIAQTGTVMVIPPGGGGTGGGGTGPHWKFTVIYNGTTTASVNNGQTTTTVSAPWSGATPAPMLLPGGYVAMSAIGTATLKAEWVDTDGTPAANPPTTVKLRMTSTVGFSGPYRYLQSSTGNAISNTRLKDYQGEEFSWVEDSASYVGFSKRRDQDWGETFSVPASGVVTKEVPLEATFRVVHAANAPTGPCCTYQSATVKEDDRKIAISRIDGAPVYELNGIKTTDTLHGYQCLLRMNMSGDWHKMPFPSTSIEYPLYIGTLIPNCIVNWIMPSRSLDSRYSPQTFISALFSEATFIVNPISGEGVAYYDWLNYLEMRDRTCTVTDNVDSFTASDLIQVFFHKKIEDYVETSRNNDETTLEVLDDTLTNIKNEQDVVSVQISTSKTYQVNSGWSLSIDPEVKIRFSDIIEGTVGASGGYDSHTANGTITQRSVTKGLHRPDGAPYGWYICHVVKVQPHYYGRSKQYRAYGQVVTALAGGFQDIFDIDFWFADEAKTGLSIYPYNGGPGNPVE